ncbi:MAG: asparaginase [Phycisphaeraceae bacterium]|nr:asparaginase [Phycisphaeraceae bacterium]
MRHVTLITTGGTIEKTYDEQTGGLANRRSLVRRMLRRLRLEETSINIVELMSKDSLELTDEDRARIVDAVRTFGGEAGSTLETDGIVILHGTDTLEVTGQWLHERIVRPRVPIVLTGAMRPFEMTRSDALQNLTESIFAVGVLEPGVYCVAHGRALGFPGVAKDRQRHTFIKK